jgi:chromosome segregation ATPase
LKAATFQEENLLSRLESLTKELEAARTNERVLQEELNSIQATSKIQEEIIQKKLDSFESVSKVKENALQKKIDSLEASLRARETALQEKTSFLKATSIEALCYRQKYRKVLILTVFLFISTAVVITFAIIQRQNSSSQNKSLLKELKNPLQSEIFRF